MPDTLTRPAAGVGPSGWSPAVAYRVVLLVLCSGLSVLVANRTYAAVPIALLAALTVATDRSRRLRRHPLRTCLVEALVTGLAVAWTGGAASPMLPYLLATGLALGLAGQPRGAVAASAAAVSGLGVGAALGGRPADLGQYVTVCGQWVLLGLAFGLVAGWAQRLTERDAVPADRYAETRAVLEQLRRVTQRLPGGLDLTSSAESLLDSCGAAALSSRSAVLVRPTATSALVQVAVRGTQRVPWRTPVSEPGPLQQAWEGGVPVVDRRPTDTDGRRRGSTLAVLPLLDADGPFGLVILESFEPDAFTSVEVDALRACLAAGALRLETALLFDQVRTTVTVEERDRLAREIHDGIAQELAYVGYQLDALRGQAGKVDSALEQQVRDVRQGLTGLISDIRLSITDLKTSVGSDRGLGAVLASYVRAVGSGQRIAVHVSLDESSFRLPGEQEVLLFQIAQVVAQDARRSPQAENLWVTLEVDPPSARLVVAHDGRGQGDLDLSDLAKHLTRVGGTLQTRALEGAGVQVHAVLEGSHRDDEGPAGR